MTETTWEDALKDWKIRKKAVQMQCECCWTQEAELAIKALEKQIPKCVQLEGDGFADGSMVYDIGICPNCDRHFEVEDEEHYKFCPDCGQRLNWDVVEEKKT